MASSGTDVTTVSLPTSSDDDNNVNSRGSFQYFQQAQRRWQSSPRRKLVTLPIRRIVSPHANTTDNDNDDDKGQQNHRSHPSSSSSSTMPATAASTTTTTTTTVMTGGTDNDDGKKLPSLKESKLKVSPNIIKAALSAINKFEPPPPTTTAKTTTTTTTVAAETTSIKESIDATELTTTDVHVPVVATKTSTTSAAVIEPPEILFQRKKDPMLLQTNEADDYDDDDVIVKQQASDAVLVDSKLRFEKDATTDLEESTEETTTTLSNLATNTETSVHSQNSSCSSETLDAATTGTHTSSSKNNKYRDRLVAFYEEYNPSKLGTVDATLAKFDGKEDELFDRLEKKYNPSGIPPPPRISICEGGGGDGDSGRPTCFLEFEYGKDDRDNRGRVEVQLFQDKTPLTVENFRALCTGGMDNNSTTGKQQQLSFRNSPVHRIVPNFVIQGGDMTRGDGTGGTSIYPPNSEHGDMWGKFKDELFMQHNRRGLLSMANNGPNTNGSQFFITLRALPNLNGKHVVFGEVTQGMEVVEQISNLPTDSKQRPLDRVVICDCGEIRDGKEIRASEFSRNMTKPAPFDFQPTAFGSVSPLKCPVSPGNTSTFSFAASSPKRLLFGGSAATKASSFAQLATEAKSTTDAKSDSAKPFSFSTPTISSETAKRSGAMDSSTDSSESSSHRTTSPSDVDDDSQDRGLFDFTACTVKSQSGTSGRSTASTAAPGISSTSDKLSCGKPADHKEEGAKHFNFTPARVQLLSDGKEANKDQADSTVPLTDGTIGIASSSLGQPTSSDGLVEKSESHDSDKSDELSDQTNESQTQGTEDHVTERATLQSLPNELKENTERQEAFISGSSVGVPVSDAVIDIASSSLGRPDEATSSDRPVEKDESHDLLDHYIERMTHGSGGP